MQRAGKYRNSQDLQINPGGLEINKNIVTIQLMKIMKYYSVLTLAAFLFMLPLNSHGQGHTLNIIYTGSISGELEPCGCSPKTDFGGVARLSGFLAAQGEGLSPYILIDAGNFSSKDTPQGRLKVDTMMRAFSLIKYDAVALMRNEQAFPEEFILPVVGKYDIPAISDSFRLKRTLSLKGGAVNINVSVDPAAGLEGRLNILLTDHPVSALKDIEGWDIIITSSGEELEGPAKSDSAIIVSGFPKGEKAGILALKVDDNGRVLASRQIWWPLGDEIEEDEKIRTVLNEYDTAVAELLKSSERPVPGTTYLGAAKCAECHQPFFESWKTTRHAGAFASLEDAGKGSDPECIICHAVGFGEKGGFFSMEATPELANVQCEECHGLDRGHIDDFSRPMRPVNETVCLKCHTKENSPDFNYPVYYEKIRH